MPAACVRGAYRLPGTGLLRSPPESRSVSTLPPAVRRLRRRRHVATGVVSRALESWPARTQGIRWREEVLFVLRASKLAVGWIVGLNALPALRPHAPAIDLFRHVVFARGLLNALPAVGPEVGDRAARCLPVMTAAADEKAKSQYQRDQPEQDHPVPPLCPPSRLFGRLRSGPAAQALARRPGASQRRSADRPRESHGRVPAAIIRGVFGLIGHVFVPDSIMFSGRARSLPALEPRGDGRLVDEGL